MRKRTSRDWSYVSTGVIDVHDIIDVIVAKCLRYRTLALSPHPRTGDVAPFPPYCCNRRPIQGGVVPPDGYYSGRGPLRALENAALCPAVTSTALSPPEALPGECLSGESHVSGVPASHLLGI